MQQQADTAQFAIDQVFIPHPKKYSQFELFIVKQFKGCETDFTEFLKNLSQSTNYIINFSSFRKFMRIMKKYVIAAKNKQLESLFSKLLIEQASKYFPYSIKSNKVNSFTQFVDLVKGLYVKQPINLDNQKQVIIYLQCACYTQQWALKLIEKINNQTIVDKKSANDKGIILNSFFSHFLDKYMDKIVPQLERLLVRSESNIQVWQQVLSNVTSFGQSQKCLQAILKKVKNYFGNFPEFCISIINSLGRAVTTVEQFKQMISFLGPVITGQHNSKKKLNYLKMTEGLLEAANKLSLKEQSKKQANFVAIEILNLCASSFSKFPQEEQLPIVLELLSKILPLVENPTDQIAKNMKILMKNQNKNVLLYFALTLSVYKKEHIEQFASVKQIFTFYKSQIGIITKKLGANWQWFVHVISFLSKADASFFENLTQDLPIFKATSASLFKLEKTHLLSLLVRFIKYTLDEQEAIPQHVYTVLAIALEDVKGRQEWKEVMSTLRLEDKLRVITKGIYPLMWYPCKELTKNKGNQFNSLVRFIISTLDKKNPLNGFQIQQFHKILIVAKVTNVSITSRIHFNKPQQANESFGKIVNDFWKASFYDYQGDEQITTLQSHKALIRIGAEQLLNIQLSQDFQDHFEECLNPNNYEKNLAYLVQFQKQVKQSQKRVKSSLNDAKQMLFEKNFSQQVKIVQNKVYLDGLKDDTKMMSQEEVKVEKYKKHFQKMVYYFGQYLRILTKNIKNEEFVFTLWDLHFKSLIKITQYPQTRLPIFIIVRRSIQRNSLQLQQFQRLYSKENHQSGLFLKYSLFFAEFFCIRHSSITPSLKMMEKSSAFLKCLLAIDFNSQFGDLIFNRKKQFITSFINDMCQQILQNMQFDLTIKKLTIFFYYKANQRLVNFNNDNILYDYILKNINILSSSEYIQSVIITIMKRIDISRYNQLFQDILSYVSDTKIIILRVINDLIIKHQVKYLPGYQEYIKLRILALEHGKPQIGQLSVQLIKNETTQTKDILRFNMKKFMKKNSKQTVQKLCIFIKQEMKQQQIQSIFKMFITTFSELFDQKLDQQGLQIFPYFLSLNIESIKITQLHDIFQLLVLKFTANESYVTLSRLSMQVGIQIIKHYSVKYIKYAEEILNVLQSFINRCSGVSNIVFLGVLAPYLQGNKNLLIVQKRITQLFKGQKQPEQKAIAKCMPDLMSFFKEPLKLVQKIWLEINGLPQSSQLGQAYLTVGLLKGIGHKKTMLYLDRLISEEHVTKTKSEKSARIYLLTAFIEIFGRFIQVKSNRIIQIAMTYMADSIEQIRNIAKRVGQTLILKMSAYSVKNLLPHLLAGLETEPNWRIKISYIWILGIMANCSARQLQTSLPIIVPTLSTCLSNAHPTIRNKASQALNLIGQTIKNPQISNSIDILIEALQNPFQKSDKALEILLKTRFSHYIDAPSLSIIIPIIDYCLRGRNSQFKASACQLIGSIVELILNPYDLLPYLKIISGGLKTALCDPLPQIRSIAAMAIGRISGKIGIANAQQYFQFILDIIQSASSNTTERQGAAQAYSQIICSHDYDYFQESLNKIFDKLNEIKSSQKQGFILVFLYVPNIRKEQFQGFIGQVNKNMYSFVADEDQNIRNSALQVEKVLINNYCLTHTDLLLEPLCEGVFETNWRKRNGALILIGQLINIIKNHMYNTRSQQKSYAYYKGLMAVYILKDDELEMPRLTANQVWNTYIENTPKTIRTGLKELVLMWSRFTHEANGVVFKNIGEFSSKYGQNYFQQILGFMTQYMKDPLLKKGVFEVLTEFIKRLQQQFMMKETFKNQIRQFFTQNIFTIEGAIRQSFARCLAIWIEKMREQQFFQDMIYPQIQKMNEINQLSAQYTQCLHLLKDLLHTSSQKMIDRLINKIMETPLSEFKIEVITNNADRLANQLYTLFKQPATQIFVQQIFLLIQDKSKENRLSLIIYCLEQVSLKLNKKFKIQFMKMMTTHLRKLVQKHQKRGQTYYYEQKQLLILKKMLGIIYFFLSSIQVQQLDDLQTLLGELTPLIFVKQYQISLQVHQIFEILISNPKSQRTPLYLKQMIVSLQNNANQRGVTLIWQDQDVALNYINILVKSIAYGNSQTMEEALDMMNFLIRFAKRQIIHNHILRIMGPVVRVVNYQLQIKQKLLLMDFISSIYTKGFNIQVYSNQILSICFRLLMEFKTKEQMIQCVANQFQNLLVQSNDKNKLMLTIISKVKVYGTVLIETIYYLIKNLMSEKIQLPKKTLQKMHQQFSKLLLQTQAKLPVNGIYYLSKTISRLAVHLGLAIQPIVSQLKAITCPYQIILSYLHYSYYKSLPISKLESIEVFIKQSSREKVYYLLKSIRLCRKANQKNKEVYSEQYVRALVPEGLSGFDDIIDVMDDYQD